MLPLDVLLVDDDALAREQLSRLLAHESIRVRACADAAEALRWLRRERYDLVATDWRLGRAPSALDGPKLSRIIRELGLHTPILLYSSGSWASRDVAQAIDVGADDFLETPLARFDELIARMRGLVRRSSGQVTMEKLRIAGFEVDVAAHRAAFDGGDLSLTRAQFALLVHFLMHVERVLTYDDLHVFMAGRTRASKGERAHVVQENVRRLRARLAAGAAQIVTIPGVGYRLTAARNDITV